ncbi:hypothetical protein HanPSC8_Chr09g0399101 [Helianthus annuus]|nr:hypothetical protein HanPSC8_Chr09g0399101 [Helianthus annuus]
MLTHIFSIWVRSGRVAGLRTWIFFTPTGSVMDCLSHTYVCVYI